MHVISGTLKGRVINQSTNSRPTTNYCKQVLFNLLSNNSFVARDIASSRVLDGFCGTGAIGFEFLSRGALHVDFIDNNKYEITILKFKHRQYFGRYAKHMFFGSWK